ncbi:VacJ family lipoprotein [Alkalilimnicola sp. S0819]|uniref:MlaA family lipoprotein n=1 Tax=Alkalilimnicola sp. S0819 TaxID=2613922 RepID=UPI00126194F1|nr:VacJ family lipoprotein [Alkalilimnicola sp. S0819]KAB7624008.1 VacJ family lipoprotein [Alkalilimnicola sp. S0819]MPQ16616.1 VacJ family lipoprotein [Alkalilimnicola sp. S0819]
MLRTPARIATLLLLALLLGGCASQGALQGETYDPLEPGNRVVYGFNDSIDRHVLAPTARGWARITPSFVRTGLSNFFHNAGYPNVVLNDLLQGKFQRGALDTGRFLTNTTLGVLGLWDPASHLGMPPHDEDLGQSFGVWGAGPGAYLVLPLFGPNSVRDVGGIPVAALTDVLNYTVSGGALIGLRVVEVINRRAELERAVRIRDEAALDPYLFTREAWLQMRRTRIHDGNPPIEYYDDELFEDDPYLDEDPTEHARAQGTR